MGKYIDADKLIAEIMALKEKYGSCVAKNEVEKCYKGGRLIGYEDALNKISKLQQEQPVCETLGQEIEKAWKPYDQLGFDLTKSQFADIARHFAMWGIHTAESCKVEEFKQEQPEVDLEKDNIID